MKIKKLNEILNKTDENLYVLVKVASGDGNFLSKVDDTHIDKHHSDDYLFIHEDKDNL